MKRFPARYASYDLDYYYDYQVCTVWSLIIPYLNQGRKYPWQLFLYQDQGDTSRTDNYDYHYQYYDDYQHSNQVPSMVRTKSGKQNRINQRKQRHQVGEHIVKTIKEENGSPSSGQITVVVVPESTFKEESRQEDRNYRNRADHGTDLKYVDSDQPEESYEHKSSDPEAEVDYNDIFDDVIDTTVNPMVAKDMWEEMTRDLSRDNHKTSKKARQKVKVKRQRRKPGVSSTTSSPPRSVEEEASQLSIWAAAERVSQDAPSIRFEDFKLGQEQVNKIDSIKEFSQSRPTTTSGEIEREFYEGFTPSRTDNSQRLGNNFKKKLKTGKCFAGLTILWHQVIIMIPSR